MPLKITTTTTTKKKTATEIMQAACAESGSAVAKKRTPCCESRKSNSNEMSSYCIASRRRKLKLDSNNSTGLGDIDLPQTEAAAAAAAAAVKLVARLQKPQEEARPHLAASMSFSKNTNPIQSEASKERRGQIFRSSSSRGHSWSAADQTYDHQHKQQRRVLHSQHHQHYCWLVVSLLFILGQLLPTTNLVLPAADAQQYRPDWPNKLVQQEIFLLNLEDGYFGCQVNESQDFLQLFELSRLCDGQAQCYGGTDEIVTQLKCNQRDQCGSASGAPAPSSSTQLVNKHEQQPIQCLNGVCLDGLCYCNDGWGGKSCDVPDENECKFRPCDVFAHCTNTMGSYYCSCFPGKLLVSVRERRCRPANNCKLEPWPS